MMQTCPKTWMLESVLATIFCCLPLGIVGIVYASKVTSYYNMENYVEAQRASSNAGMWTAISFVVGISGGVLGFISHLFFPFLFWGHCF